MQINKLTSTINLGLLYDRIYYFPSRNDSFLNEVMNEAVERWRCMGEIWRSELFLPRYKFQIVPEELMSGLYKEAAPDAPEREYTNELLKKMMGCEDGGVLVVRLYPKDKDFTDELLVCSDISYYWSGEIDCILNTIAEKAFYENFERVTGMSYQSYRKQLDKETENIVANRSTDLKIMGSKEFSAKSSPDYKARRRMDVYLGKMKSQIDTARNEDLEEMAKKLISEIQDEKKLKTRRKILVEYECSDDYDKPSFLYEIYVVKSEDVRIRCDFGRDLCKVFYVFLLKHQGGVQLKDLYKYRNELIQIYSKFSNLEEGNRADSVDGISDNKRINQLKSVIKKTFDNVFGAAIASDYYVYGTADSYSIKLDRKYVDLGVFESSE